MAWGCLGPGRRQRPGPSAAGRRASAGPASARHLCVCGCVRAGGGRIRRLGFESPPLLSSGWTPAGFLPTKFCYDLTFCFLFLENWDNLTPEAVVRIKQENTFFEKRRAIDRLHAFIQSLSTELLLSGRRRPSPGVRGEWDRWDPVLTEPAAERGRGQHTPPGWREVSRC